MTAVNIVLLHIFLKKEIKLTYSLDENCMLIFAEGDVTKEALMAAFLKNMSACFGEKFQNEEYYRFEIELKQDTNDNNNSRALNLTGVCQVLMQIMYDLPEITFM